MTDGGTIDVATAITSAAFYIANAPLFQEESVWKILFGAENI